MTLGENALELQKKDLDSDYIELQKEMHKGSNSKKSFEEEIYECALRGVKDKKIKGDFFVVVLSQKNRLLPNVIRQFFLYRQSCPTPTYDQVVYRYKRDENEIEFIWTIPSVETCKVLPIIKEELPFDHYPLLDFIRKFHEGKLDRQCDFFNKSIDSK